MSAQDRAAVAVEQTVALCRDATPDEIMAAALYLAPLAASYLHHRAAVDGPGAMLAAARLGMDSPLAIRLVREHLIGLDSPLQIVERP